MMHEHPNLPRARTRLIEQIARSLIERFGSDALSVASRQAEAGEKLDPSVARSWHEIAVKIESLQTLSDATASSTTDRNFDIDSAHNGEDVGLT
ncbi:hypothetical protein [Sphingomonas glacialis]|uniref:hypothetical protein n=1 Tax=Sphingomonas glacialis TaxID=658225 RepID=UPI001126B5F6|nr:hypothetical protein [Sphingomonas glacialis]